MAFAFLFHQLNYPHAPHPHHRRQLRHRLHRRTRLLALARTGAHILLACRDRAKGEAALTRLRTEIPNASAEFLKLDLASLTSIRTLPESILDQPLDTLIHNAGVFAPPHRRTTQDGFELQFGTNVLGPFALTAQLLPALKLAPCRPHHHRGLHRPQARPHCL